MKELLKDAPMGHLTARKAKTVTETGYIPSGIILLNPETGERTLVELSCVRWMTNEDFNKVMHGGKKPE